MNKTSATWGIFGIYTLIIIIMLIFGTAFSQTKLCDKDICVVEFNAGWNESNGADYLDKLTDCGIKSCLLYTSPSPRDRTRSRMPSSA